MASRPGHQPTLLQRRLRRFAATRPGAWLFARVLHRIDRLAFRWTGGRRTLTAMLSGLPVIMLTTTGARTGLARTVPVLGFPIGADVAVVAGNFGQQFDPAWCVNLRHEPHAHVVRDGESQHVLAEELTGGAREAAWRRALEIYSGAAAYERRAGGRTLGVFLLRPDSRPPETA